MKKSCYSSFIIHHSDNKGQSLIEILVALAVGTILIIAAVSVIAPALRANTQADKVQVSSALGKELLENVRVFSEANWYNISSLATSSANKYFLVSVSSPFVAATGTEGISADGVTSGLVGYWKLDESTGTVAYDFSGNGNNGTSTNGPTSVSGQVGQALSFNGTNNYVTIGNPSNLQFDTNTPFSVSFWVKAPSAATNVGFVTKTPTINGIGWYVWSFSGYNSLRFSFYNGTTAYVVSTSQIINDGTWHFATVTFDGSQNRSGMKAYFDGDLSGTGTNGAMSFSVLNSNPVNIGARNNNGNFLNGIMDEVRIYNRALSAAEIKTIYTSNIYTRYFYLDTVGRDVSDALLSSGGTNDPSTEKATVVYGWLNGPTSSFSMYLTRVRNNGFDQTDWSGGSGQEGPATTTNSSFSTSTKIYHSTTTGSIIINFQ